MAQNFFSPLSIVVVVPAIAMQYLSEQTLRSLAIAPIFNAMLIIRDALLKRASATSVTPEFVCATNRQMILRFQEKSVADGPSTPRLVRYIQILSKRSEDLIPGQVQESSWTPKSEIPA